MDQLAALQHIFGNALRTTPEGIAITFQTTEYHATLPELQIISPTHSYADVYDYILHDSQFQEATALIEQRTATTGAAEREVIPITESQFKAWQQTRIAGIEPHSGSLTGREIWQASRQVVQD